MSLLRSAIRSRFGLRLSDPIGSRPSLPFMNESRKCFSTETGQPPEGLRGDGFFKPSETGSVYGKLLGLSRRTLKTDVLNVLDGCNLTPDDVRFSYTRGSFAPFGTYVQFPSRSSYDTALRLIAKKGRLFRLEKADRSQWDVVSPYDGKVLVLHGIPRNALNDDIDRFLSGCDYHASSIQFVTRPAIPDPVRMALVRFPSQTQAMNAFITRNRGFCLNNQITLQVLQ